MQDTIQITKESLLALIELARECGVIDAALLTAATRDFEAAASLQKEVEKSTELLNRQLKVLGFEQTEISSYYEPSPSAVATRSKLLSLLIKISMTQEGFHPLLAH